MHDGPICQGWTAFRALAQPFQFSDGQYRAIFPPFSECVRNAKPAPQVAVQGMVAREGRLSPPRGQNQSGSAIV